VVDGLELPRSGGQFTLPHHHQQHESWHDEPTRPSSGLRLWRSRRAERKEPLRLSTSARARSQKTMRPARFRRHSSPRPCLRQTRTRRWSANAPRHAVLRVSAVRHFGLALRVGKRDEGGWEHDQAVESAGNQNDRTKHFGGYSRRNESKGRQTQKGRGGQRRRTRGGMKSRAMATTHYAGWFFSTSSHVYQRAESGERIASFCCSLLESPPALAYPAPPQHAKGRPNRFGLCGDYSPIPHPSSILHGLLASHRAEDRPLQ